MSWNRDEYRPRDDDDDDDEDELGENVCAPPCNSMHYTMMVFDSDNRVGL